MTCSDPVLHVGGHLYDQALSSFGTLRGRMGWTNGPSLLYLTGGGAYGQVDTNLAGNRPPILQITNVRDGKWGWTGGGGLESQIAGNVTAKLEYLYLDLGKTAGQSVIDLSGGAGTDLQTFGFSSRLHEYVFRAGLNYRFGDPGNIASANAMDQSLAPLATGFYLGGNAGVALGRNPTNFHERDVAADIVVYNDQVNLNPVGGVLGGQAGYLVKVAPNWLAGVETDFQGAHLNDTTTCFVNCASSQAAGPGFGSPAISMSGVAQHEDWFVTLRGRAGWTNGSTFYYATGGAALGRIVTDVNLLSVTLSPVYSPYAAGAATIAATKWGWVAGGGIETALSTNLSLKGEYLYMDFGGVSGTLLRNAGPDVITVSSVVRNHLFRLGLNYHPDWDVLGWN